MYIILCDGFWDSLLFKLISSPALPIETRSRINWDLLGAAFDMI